MDTFVIRLYSERNQQRPGDARLCGVVEEISTGLRATFRGDAELLAILQRRTSESAAAVGIPEQRLGVD